jgi:hypothetical protein
MPFYERDDVRIHYQEAGSGFPLLVIPGGGLNSTIEGLATSSHRNRGKTPGGTASDQASWLRQRMSSGRCGTIGPPETQSLAPR